jgi:hypothetical protein
MLTDKNGTRASRGCGPLGFFILLSLGEPIRAVFFNLTCYDIHKV